MNVAFPAERKHTVNGSSYHRQHEEPSSSLGVDAVSDTLFMTHSFSLQHLGFPASSVWALSDTPMSCVFNECLMWVGPEAEATQVRKSSLAGDRGVARDMFVLYMSGKNTDLFASLMHPSDFSKTTITEMQALVVCSFSL